jgi:hypothetical protein
MKLCTMIVTVVPKVCGKKSDNEGHKLSAAHFTQLFYRSGLLSQSDASIWALCGCPESCQ